MSNTYVAIDTPRLTAPSLDHLFLPSFLSILTPPILAFPGNVFPHLPQNPFLGFPGVTGVGLFSFICPLLPPLAISHLTDCVPDPLPAEAVPQEQRGAG